MGSIPSMIYPELFSFSRIRRFRRVFTRYDKTDEMLSDFINITLIADILR